MTLLARLSFVAAALTLAPALLGCDGALGTIRVDLVTAPGSDPLADAELVRLTLDNPPSTTQATRNSDGSFALALEVVADGQVGRVTLEAENAAGEVIAVGYSGALPIAAIDASITLYIAAPDTLAEAPVALDPPRSELATARLPYGVLWAGGRTADGAPVDDLVLYNLFTHDFQQGAPLPEPRAGMTAVTGLYQYVYLFGGQDSAGATRSQFWRFNTDAAPAGDYVELGSSPELAASGADAVIIGTELFLLASNPAAVLDGARWEARAVSAPALSGRAVTLELAALTVTSLIAGEGVGDSGAILYKDGEFVPPATPPAELRRTGHGLVAIGAGDALVVGGARDGAPEASAVRFHLNNSSFEVLADFLETPRVDASIAATATRLVVAGGRDVNGDLVPTAEIFQLGAEIVHFSTIPLLVPRAGATAQALSNGQVIIAGGTDENGAPIGTIELYTP